MNAPNQLSFLPDDYLARKAQRRSNFVCCMLFLIVMTAIGVAFVVTEKSVAADREQNALVNKEYAAEAKRIALVQELERKRQTMAQQAELAASLLEKVPRSFILAEITNAMPAGVSLLDFALDARRQAAPVPAAQTSAFERRRGKEKAAAPPPVAPASYRVAMKMTGIAATDVQVSQFLSQLNKSKYLSEVNLIITDLFQRDNEQLRRFQIELVLDPRAEVMSRDEKMAEKTVSVPLND
jgi:Tfp pilus assembly protein PilN